MTNFTHKNLLDVDNAAAGRERWARWTGSPLRPQRDRVRAPRHQLLLGSPNFRTPFGHSHREQEEAYVIVSGSGRMRLEDEIIELKPWDVVRVAPTVVRAYESGPDGLVIIAVGNDRPEGGDGEMVKDFWTD